MAAERVTLVLGGGGMKGLAHIGAYRAVQESGYEIARIIGTSIGALVGACIAGGMDADRLLVLARALQKPDIVTLNRWALLFNGLRQQSVFRGDVFMSYIDAVLPAESFDELQLPLSVNAVDLGTGEEVWFGDGGRMDVALAEAVYASCALPVFYPPARIGDDWFADGGVTDPLPIRRALALGPGRVIAIDVAAGPEADPEDTVEKGMVAIHHRAMQIMGYARRQELLAESLTPDVVYVRPELDGYSTFDFASTEYFLEEGYRATAAVLGTSVTGPREAAG